MQILDLYTPLLASLGKGYRGYEVFETNEPLRLVLPIVRNWKLDQVAIEAWFTSAEGVRKRATAEGYLSVAPAVVRKVESLFGRELPGILLLMPSFGDFDGFARYELGEHRVMLGIDFPDADVDYLKALTAHELSHVYRDHSPEVWRHLGKPLAKVTRQEYLDGTTVQEHLVSEGLATLFSQSVFPEIPSHVHHFYEPAEWDWCVKNEAAIEAALVTCLAGDEDVWSFYGESRAGRGSPSRLQYYWAAKKLRRELGDGLGKAESLLRLHERPSSDFPIFRGSTSGKN
jgi:hypothetical protein